MIYIFKNKITEEESIECNEYDAKSFAKTLNNPDNYTITIMEFNQVIEPETEIETIFNL